MFDDLTPSELELSKMEVFIALAEIQLDAVPDSGIRALVDSKLKPHVVELRAAIRAKKIGKGKTNENKF